MFWADLCTFLTLLYSIAHFLTFSLRLGEITIDACITVSGFMAATDQSCYTLPIGEQLLAKGFRAHEVFKERMKREREQAAEKATATERKRKLEEQAS
jgi:hypothetical protein